MLYNRGKKETLQIFLLPDNSWLPLLSVSGCLWSRLVIFNEGEETTERERERDRNRERETESMAGYIFQLVKYET